MKQKRRGFTLIELLAVIVILAIIALIAVPVIMNIITSARKSAFEDTAYGLISAGEMYYAQALLENGMTSDVEFTIEDGEFVGENKLDVKGALPKSGSMVVTKDGKVGVVISNGTMCAKKRVDDTKVKLEETLEYCTLEPTLKELSKTNDFATSVDECVTSGTCATGTKFAIEVAPNNIQNFYVVSDTDNKVTLIMDRNIGETVAWISKDDYIKAGGTDAEWSINFEEQGYYGNNSKGPLTAINYLESQTAVWTNIPAKNYTLIDDGGGDKYSISRTNARTRLITYTEANNLIYSTSWLFENGDHWTSGAYKTNFFIAYDVTTGFINTNYVNTEHNSGVRPVIEISK